MSRFHREDKMSNKETESGRLPGSVFLVLMGCDKRMISTKVGPQGFAQRFINVDICRKK